MDPARLQQGELRSEVMFKEDKKYHIDLKVRSIMRIAVINQIVLFTSERSWRRASQWLIPAISEG